ncbi:methionine ABC transporter permease [Heyndrickxia ginsengihumi]|uniref:ABC transporter permease n=1 Tax=Heyndrickxia ginsengihumi TaxID=363870 RepID=A0A0A6VEX7_9BACI|nr:methionine ABC transporter permease [Heyndrickxia ginsengihumi]KHD86780.1 methionine ABC transporter permease [Heyndrickxia ginsengihumi]MBE6185053.1 ABC transporter permease [Bacillus sp. (in: firmicutes)]MCM3022256.1 ABC transporter permease [Heyndrickxia ginsengihumi]NEY18489.1 ABC transporter permease [Heyndrickxia ginsengihumi]
MAFDWSWFWPEFLTAIDQTLYMVIAALIISVIIGIPIGVILVITREDGILENKFIFNILNIIINIFRSIPFIILVVAIIPFTRLVVGTAIGTTAAIVPLVLYTAFYIGRLIENSLLEVDKGTIELAQAMGATPWQIIWRFLLPEALGSMVLALTIATVGLIGASAMAGAVGAGGIGDLAITYGYNQFKTEVMVITVVTLVIMVQIVQSLGNFLSKKIRRK